MDIFFKICLSLSLSFFKNKLHDEQLSHNLPSTSEALTDERSDTDRCPCVNPGTVVARGSFSLLHVTSQDSHVMSRTRHGP